MVNKLALAVCCLLLGVINAHNLADDYSDEVKEWLANLKIEQLPRHFQLLLQKMGRGSTNSGYCCNNGVHDTFTIQTHVATLTYVHAVPVDTETACGVFNAGRCHHHSYEYTQKVMTYVAKEYVPGSAPCSDAHIVCCENHIKIVDSCVDIRPYAHNLEELIALKNAGFVK